MEPTDFLKLIKNSKCLIGNSSVGIREAAFLGIPVVNIGGRQIGRERGSNVMDIGYDAEAIIEGTKAQIAHGSYASDTIYGTGDAGKNIANVLAQIAPSINKMLTY